MGITVADLMTAEPVTLTTEMTVKEMDAVLNRYGISGAPVVELHRLVGVASQADIIRTLWEDQHAVAEGVALLQDTGMLLPLTVVERIQQDSRDLAARVLELKVRDLMTADPKVAHPDEDIREAAERMSSGGIHRLPVTDRASGNLVGILTSMDIVTAVQRGLLRAAA